MPQVTVTGGTLFEIASDYLGDISRWTALAALNGIDDPWLVGVTVIALPTGATIPGGQNGGS